MNRKELYDYIIEHQLRDKVYQLFGRNYTNISNSQLYDFITAYISEMVDACKDINKNKCFETNTKNTLKVSKVDKLVEVLLKKRILLQSEYEYIMQ